MNLPSNQIPVYDVSKLLKLLGVESPIRNKKMVVEEMVSRVERGIHVSPSLRQYCNLGKGRGVANTVETTTTSINKILNQKKIFVPVSIVPTILSYILLDSRANLDHLKIRFTETHIQQLFTHFPKHDLENLSILKSVLNTMFNELAPHSNFSENLQLSDHWQLNASTIEWDAVAAYEQSLNKSAEKEEQPGDLVVEQQRNKLEKLHETNPEEVTITTAKVIVKTGEIQIDVEEDDEDNDDFSPLLICIALIESWNLNHALNNEDQEVNKSTNFVFKTPLSLIKKIYQSEWEVLENTIAQKENSFGVEYVKIPNEDSYLVLNKYGHIKRELISHHYDDSIYMDILINCDSKIGAEKKLFEELLLKKRFFKSVFQDFRFSLEYLVEKDRFPSIEKRILFNRVIALYFDSLDGDENIESMRYYFNQCIELAKANPSDIRTSFFIEFANKELRLGNTKKAIELLSYVVENYDRTNTTSRFMIAELLFDQQNKQKAVEYFLSPVKIQNRLIPFYQTSDFIDIFIKRISSYIRGNQQGKALLLQNLGKYFGTHLSTQEGNNFTEVLFSRLKEKTNNHLFRKGLIEYYLQHDLNQARQELTELDELENFNAVDRVYLNMAYLNACENPKSAIDYGLKFIEEHPDTKVDKIYFLLGKIYSRNLEDYLSAVESFEKMSGQTMHYKTEYLRSLLKIGDTRAFQLVEQFLKKYPNSTSMKLITPYLNHCIKRRNFEKASVFIAEKLKNAKAHEYDDLFMSFLFQQQLRLTNNELFLQTIRDKALEFAIDNLQKSMVYFKLGLNFLEKFNPAEIKKIKDNQEVQRHKVEKALEQFQIAIDLESRIDNWEVRGKIHFKIAECRYYLGEYDEALGMLNTITNYKPNAITELMVSIYIKLENRKKLFEIYNNIEDPKHKQSIAFLLATASLFNKKTTKSLFEASIVEYYKYDRRLAYAIYLYKKGEHFLSRKILSKDGIKKVPKHVHKKYMIAIYRFKKPVDQKVVIAIKNKVTKALKKKFIDYDLLNEIDAQTKKNQFDSALYVIKFNYMMAKGMLAQCDQLLNWLIRLDFIDKEIAHLYFQLADKYYRTASRERKKMSRKDQFDKLKSAQKYVEYALYFNQYDFACNRLRCFILYKLGDHELFTQTAKAFTNSLPSFSKPEFIKALKKAKQIIKIFIWEERFLDYDTRLNFYLTQEKWAMIFFEQEKVHDEVSIKILSSILDDKSFHIKNEHILENRIKRKLAWYYYKEKEDFRTALKYQLDIYKKIDLHGGFVTAFINTLFKLEMFKEGEKKIIFYLKNHPTQSIYRKHGDFLRELKDYQGAHSAYTNSINFNSNDPIQTSYAYRGILELFRRCIENNDCFIKKSNMKNQTEMAYQSIQELNPRYEKFDEARETYKYILKYCEFVE